MKSDLSLVVIFDGLQVTISFAKLLLRSIRPGIEELGRLSGTDIFCDISQYPMAIKIPAIVIIRVNSALCFDNANFIRERYRSYAFLFFILFFYFYM